MRRDTGGNPEAAPHGGAGADIRLPIGALFTVLGCMLVAHGLTGDPAGYARALGYNANLLWGAVLLVFGLAMTHFGRRAGARAARAARSTTRPGP